MLRVSVGGESGEREIRVEHLNTVFIYVPMIQFFLFTVTCEASCVVVVVMIFM